MPKDGCVGSGSVDWEYGYINISIIQVVDLSSVSEPFPDGDYALPMPQVGCGDGGSVDWEYGYINISFRWPVGYYSRRPLGDYKQTPVSLPGPYSPWSLQLNFCTRSTNTSTASIGSENSRWPGGLYSIFGTKEGCPDGKHR